jgi:hypothetical protein
MGSFSIFHWIIVLVIVLGFLGILAGFAWLLWRVGNRPRVDAPPPVQTGRTTRTTDSR